MFLHRIRVSARGRRGGATVSHSLGEWYASGNYVYVKDNEIGLPTLIARCPDVEGTPYNDNARVMAAGKALLEACEVAVFVLEQLKETEPLFERSWNINTALECTKTAIAKAKGVQP